MYHLYVYTVFFQNAKAFGCMYTVEQHTRKIKKRGKTLQFYSGVMLLHVLLSDVTLEHQISHDLVQSFEANYSFLFCELC